jgi:glycosyltransferase involved in cell wall biosynthesis
MPTQATQPEHSSDASRVALLTGGGDRPYAHGLAMSLAARGVAMDFVGSDYLDSASLRADPRIRFLNLRGDMSPDAPVLQKVLRVLLFYARLMRFVAIAQPKILHVLWNDRLEFLDRTLLPWLYHRLGKRVVLTVHNVNKAERDNNDSWLNRATLRLQYRQMDHLFVHTVRMKEQLCREFEVAAERVSVIPFGVNDTSPRTTISGPEARSRLGIPATDRCVLFFGNIAPYKGLAHLVESCGLLRERLPGLRLVIAGRTKGSEEHWCAIERRIEALGLRSQVLQCIEYIRDEDIELYFKAADVLALPYTHVFQSGVLFLSYSFGLPVIASDIASFREDVIEGQTGWISPVADPTALAQAIERHFDSDLYRGLDRHRDAIRDFALERYSWARVAEITDGVYQQLVPDTSRSG